MLGGCSSSHVLFNYCASYIQIIGHSPEFLIGCQKKSQIIEQEEETNRIQFKHGSYFWILGFFSPSHSLWFLCCLFSYSLYLSKKMKTSLYICFPPFLFQQAGTWMSISQKGRGDKTSIWNLKEVTTLQWKSMKGSKNCPRFQRVFSPGTHCPAWNQSRCLFLSAICLDMCKGILWFLYEIYLSASTEWQVGKMTTKFKRNLPSPTDLLHVPPLFFFFLPRKSVHRFPTECSHSM